MLSKGIDVSTFFNTAVLQITTQNVTLKKLLYLYLSHYADHNATTRELTLLSINTFQKDLSSPIVAVRGLSLRALTDLTLPSILQIQLLSIQKASRDTEPYVRKCAVSAALKVSNRSGKVARTQVTEVVLRLLDDPSTAVMGPAASAFAALGMEPEELHGRYRRLCGLLCDFDEWSQCAVLGLLCSYARMSFRRPPDGRARAIDEEKRRRVAEVAVGGGAGREDNHELQEGGGRQESRNQHSGCGMYGARQALAG